MSLNIDVVFPEYVYHGTKYEILELFQEQLICPDKWANGRDFGRGFYTTIDLIQAQNWGIQKYLKRAEEPLVLKIKVDISQYKLGRVNQHCFLGESIDWAKYILDHRRYSNEKSDPCRTEHADIIVGPMADGDTGYVLTRYENEEGCNSLEWFYDNITRSKTGKKLNGLQLGNQIVFCTPQVAVDTLTLEGWYEYNHIKGRWDYHENK